MTIVVRHAHTHTLTQTHSQHNMPVYTSTIPLHAQIRAKVTCTEPSPVISTCLFYRYFVALCVALPVRRRIYIAAPSISLDLRLSVLLRHGSHYGQLVPP